MMRDYRDSHLSQDKGEAYHRTFIEKPYRRMVWQFEKQILDKIIATFYAGIEIHHLDFACGTGRILMHLEDRVFTSVGVDLSPSMLCVARKNQERCELIQADLTRDDVLGNRKFNLITAFRFFPNAQPELRMDAMKVLVKHLDNNGYLVFNNHKNSSSLINRLLMLTGRITSKVMSNAEVEELLIKNDMEIVEIHHLCVFPASEKHTLLPFTLLRYVETILASFTIFRCFAQNLLFVCKHAAK